MFSHLVTAAKGLFTAQEAAEATADTTTSLSNRTIPPRSAMVTSSIQRDLASENETLAESSESTNNGSVMANGKRKAQTTGSRKANDQNNKRRKRTSEEIEEDGDVNGESNSKDTTSVGKESGKHFRFGSEEPELPVNTRGEETSETIQPDNQDDGEDSSDDEAPEAIDNSAQLSKIKAETKKRERARHIEEQLKREKRRQLDEFHKLQAKSVPNKKKDALVSPKLGTSPDDLVSESTATLQGSTTQDKRRVALPALLPDEILNAAPVVRPPTPPVEELGFGQRKPNKLRFLEKTEKPPKDVKMGDMTIRVLDENSTQRKSKTLLAPKASKSGRNLKESWLKRDRCTAHVNGLRRTTGGSSGFVRR